MSITRFPTAGGSGPFRADNTDLTGAAVGALLAVSQVSPLSFGLTDPSGGSGSGNGFSGQLVTDHGADPTGVTSSTAAFQAALTAGDVLIPAGIYRVGLVTYAGLTSRRIVALGRVRIVQTDAQGVFDLRGGWDDLGVVASYATTTTNLVAPGESAPTSSDSSVSVLTMAAPVTLAPGDIIKIVSDDQVPTGRNANYRMGEYSVIPEAVTASTTVPLSNVLVDAYATNVRLARLFKTRFEITGPIVFDTDPAIADATTGQAAVALRAAQNCYVGDGVEFHNSIGRALGNFTYAALIEGVRFRNLANRPNVNQFGYGVQDGGWQTRMVSCHGENLRHLYSEGTYEQTAGSALFEYFGGGWFGLVEGCTATGCSSQAFDTHGTAYGTVFTGCRVYGGFVGAGSGGGGYVARGRNITFTGCYADRSFRGFTIAAAGTQLYDCVARSCRFSALEISGDTSDAATVTTLGGIYVSGGIFETTDGGFATALLGQSGYTITADIERARFRKTGAPGNGARMVEVNAGCSIKYADLIVDWESYVRVPGDGVTAFRLTDATASVFGRRLNHLCGTANVTSFTGFAPSGAPANAAPIEVYDFEHRHSSVGITLFNAALTAKKASFRSYFGASWFQRLTSTDLTLVAAAAAVLPIADKLDPVITVRLTGSAGAVTLAAIPATALIGGQILHVLNASNGDVTLSSVVIPATTGRASFVFSQGVWRQIG